MTNNLEWDVRIQINEPSGRSDSVIFGEAADGIDGPPADKYDIPKPPRPFQPYIYAWFNDGLSTPYTSLLRDCRKFPDTHKQWNLSVECMGLGETLVTLSWETAKVNASEYSRVMLYDLQTNSSVEMKTVGVYTFNATPNTTFKFEIVAINTPPYIPSNPIPADNAADVSVQTTLGWTGGDPDPGDHVTYDVYFGTTNPPPKIIANKSTTTHSQGMLSYNTQYFWRIIAWDSYGASTVGPLWRFTTASASPGDPGGGGGMPPPVNQPPVADASAGEPYQGVVYSSILFNGSLSYDPDADGYIASWDWTFGDGASGSGEIVFHTYTEAGIYPVILTVTDNNGAQDSYETVAVIGKPNLPPTSPLVDGPTYGNKMIEYAFTAVSTDPDNDSLQYEFDWGDGQITTTEFYPSGTEVIVNHTWTSAGKYEMTVTAFDNQTVSEPTRFTLYIDAREVGDIGYLIDEDGDGVYDLLYSYEIDQTTSVKRQADGTYLIDFNGDGEWDYQYNSTTDSLTEIPMRERSGDEILYIVILIGGFLFLALVVYVYKRRYR